MSKRELVERWFGDFWERGDFSALDTLLAPSLDTNDLLDGLTTPRRDFPQLVEIIHQLIGKPRIEILLFLEDGDWTTTRYVMRSDGPDGGTPLSVEGITLIRFEGDKIAELSSKFDSFTLFEQLGQLPPEALVACLSGNSLTWA
ncbi:nuclear transport factor 2 family protein [Pseudophaeobacter sp.]|uniref:ester cyclase n=1 Tax=Pseudophaeobacter sp. TaxID=1971739 RepID=UPI0032968F3A